MVAFPVYRSYLPEGARALAGRRSTAAGAARPDLAAALSTLDAAGARGPARRAGHPHPADVRHGRGQGRRGHRVLPLHPARRAQRGRRRARPVRRAASAEFHAGAAAREAGWPATHDRTVHARHQALGGRARPDRGAGRAGAGVRRPPCAAGPRGAARRADAGPAGLADAGRRVADQRPSGCAAYLDKAAKEAKLRTSLGRPRRAVRAGGGRAGRRRSWATPSCARRSTAFVDRVRQPGWSNALGQKLVQLAGPGRAGRLPGHRAVGPLAGRPGQPPRRSTTRPASRCSPASRRAGSRRSTTRARRSCTWSARVLRLRRERPALFTGYRPLHADGPRPSTWWPSPATGADRGGHPAAGRPAPNGGWQDTVLALPAGALDRPPDPPHRSPADSPAGRPARPATRRTPGRRRTHRTGRSTHPRRRRAGSTHEPHLRVGPAPRPRPPGRGDATHDMTPRRPRLVARRRRRARHRLRVPPRRRRHAAARPALGLAARRRARAVAGLRPRAPSPGPTTRGPGRALAGSVLYELHIGTFTPGRHVRRGRSSGSTTSSTSASTSSRCCRSTRSTAPRAGATTASLWGAVHEPYGGPGRVQAVRRRLPRARARRAARRRLQPPRAVGRLPRPVRPLLRRPERLGPGAQPRRAAAPTRCAATCSTTRWAGCATSTSTGCGSTPCTRWSTTGAAHAARGAGRRGRRACRRRSAGRCTLIAESDLNDPRWSRRATRAGSAWTRSGRDDLHHALHVRADRGDRRLLRRLRRARRAGHDAARGVLPRRHVVVVPRPHARPARRHRSATPATGSSSYLQNHDQIGNRATGDRISATISPGLQACGAAIVLLLPVHADAVHGGGVGGEHAVAVLRLVPRPGAGRGRPHRPPRASSAGTAGASPRCPTRWIRRPSSARRCDWAELAAPAHRAMLDLYRSLIALRRAHPELADPRLDHFLVEAADSWLVLHRGALRVVVNLGTDGGEDPPGPHRPGPPGLGRPRPDRHAPGHATRVVRGDVSGVHLQRHLRRPRSRHAGPLLGGRHGLPHHRRTPGLRPPACARRTRRPPHPVLPGRRPGRGQEPHARRPGLPHPGGRDRPPPRAGRHAGRPRPARGARATAPDGSCSATRKATSSASAELRYSHWWASARWTAVFGPDLRAWAPEKGARPWTTSSSRPASGSSSPRSTSSSASPASPTARLKALEVELDRCWDLLRQRRARRAAGENPDEAAARPGNVVEGYLQ